jgi:hypothetical protein
MKKQVFLFVSASLLLTSCGNIRFAGAKPRGLRDATAGGGMHLTLTQPRKAFRVGAPIEIEAVFSNVSDQHISFTFRPETLVSDSISVAGDSKVSMIDGKAVTERIGTTYVRTDHTVVSARRLSTSRRSIDASRRQTSEIEMTKRDIWIDLPPKGRRATSFDLRTVPLDEDLSIPGRFVISVSCSSGSKRTHPQPSDYRQDRMVTSNEILIEIVEWK